MDINPCDPRERGGFPCQSDRNFSAAFWSIEFVGACAMRRSSAKSPSRGNDKAAAIRRQRAAWLNPSDDAQPHPTEPTTGRQRHSDFRTAAGASALASAETGRRSDHLVAGSDDGEVIDEFAEQLREASAAEQREKELRKDRAMSAIRVRLCDRTFWPDVASHRLAVSWAMPGAVIL